jgi:O-antigen/teichoic acid export membrane protein
MRIPDSFRSVRLLFDVGFLTMLRVVAIVIGLAYVKIYTNRLTPDALGIFFYLGTLSYLLNALLFVPFDFYLQAYCSRAGERLPIGPVVRMTAGVLIAALILVAAIGTVLIALGQLAILDIVSLYVVAALLFGCISLRNLLNNRGHRRVVAGALVFEAAGRVCAFVSLILFVTPSGRILFASAGIALFLELIGLAIYAVFRLQWASDATPPASSALIPATAPVSVSAACNLVQLQAYRTMYPWASNPAPAAIFAVVANVGSAGMSAVGQIFAQILLPRIYQSQGTYTRHYIRWALLLTLAVAAFAWIAAPLLVAFITSPQYSAYAELMVFGVLLEGANVIVSAVTVGSMLKGDTRRLMVWNIAGAVVGAAGYAVALTIAPTSPVAIGVALLLSQMVVLGGLGLNARRQNS